MKLKKELKELGRRAKGFLNIHRSSQQGISNGTAHTIDCHQDTHRALQVQIHKKTPRVDWLEQIGTLKIGVSPCY